MAVISDNFESGVATQLELSELDDASLLQWITNPEAAEEHLRRKYGAERSLSPGVFDARHLPGKHDQSSHGHGDGNVGGVDPDLKVLDRHQAHPFGARWQESADLEERAGGLWSESYDGNVSVRQAMANDKAGRPTLEGVQTDRFWFKYNYLRIEDANGVAGKVYSEKNMAADIRNSAKVMQHKLDTAPTIRRPLYRGVKMNRDQIPKAGDSFEHDVASWTSDRGWAAVYANATDDASLGIVGDHAVVYRMVGSKKAADIDGIVGGYQRGSGEHIAAGKYRVNRVTRKGRAVNVEVEQIND